MGFGDWPARERPCRRRSLCLSFAVVSLRFTSPSCQRAPCPSSGSDLISYGGFGFGATTLSSGGSWWRKWHACSVVVFFREVEAFVDPPPPALASGKGVFFRFAFAGFQFWRAEASTAPRFHLGSRCSLGKGF